MSNSSPATYSRERDRSVRSSAGRSIFDNKRVSELVGFLLAVAGLLITLSLISHVAKDPSLNTATPSGAVTHNWVGPVGSYGSDLLYQGFGWIAYLLPLALFIYKFHSKAFPELSPNFSLEKSAVINKADGYARSFGFDLEKARDCLR